MNAYVFKSKRNHLLISEPFQKSTTNRYDPVCIKFPEKYIWHHLTNIITKASAFKWRNSENTKKWKKSYRYFRITRSSKRLHDLTDLGLNSCKFMLVKKCLEMRADFFLQSRRWKLCCMQKFMPNNLQQWLRSKVWIQTYKVEQDAVRYGMWTSTSHKTERDI